MLVADGVGGKQAGEVASDLTARAIEEFLLNTLRRFTNLKPDEEQVALRDLQAALYRADARIFEEAAGHPEWRGMGATLTLAFIAGWRLFVAHAGDSRCYLFSAGKLRQRQRQRRLRTACGDGFQPPAASGVVVANLHPIRTGHPRR